MRRLAAGVLALLFCSCVLLAGCRSPHESADGAASSPLVVIPRPEGSGMDSLAGGTLTLNGDCLTLVSDGSEWLPLFPNTAEWVDGALIWNGVQYRPGDFIELGGGGGGLASESSFEIPHACPDIVTWLVD